ncbi:MAG TPA: hypothetical protein VI056_12000 [Candidatus Limnocylindria bacterium]
MGVLPAADVGSAAREHGALMVSGFVGTLICLERALVARRGWALLAPLCSGLGAIGVILGTPQPLPALAIAVAAVALVAITLFGVTPGPTIVMAVMAAGAASWAVGALLWAVGAEPFRAVPWWAAFLVLTVAAERMDLSRALRPSSGALAVFIVVTVLLVLGVTVTLVDFGLGIRVSGWALLVLALWLAVRDHPPAASRSLPMPRYIGTAIAISYAWLAVGALLMLTYDGVPAGWRYDALVHSVFIGFVMTMILAHGPIILPAIAGVAVAYSPLLYIPLVLLQSSMVLRVAGDIMERVDWRDSGATLNAIAVLTFAATMAIAVRRRRPGSRGALAAARR